MSYGLSPVANATVAGSSGGTTAGVNTTGADLLVAVFSWYNGGTRPTVSDSKSNTWTQIGTDQAGAITDVAMYYVASPTVGSGHTFTLSGAGSFSSLEIEAWSGSAASPLDQTSQAAAYQAGSVTPTQDNELLVAGVGGQDTQSITAIDLGFTISDNNAYSAGNNEAGAMAYLVETTAAAKNPTWTTGGAAAATPTIIATFKAAASGGITGTLAATEASDTATFTGTTGSTGTLAATEASDTATFTGTTGSTGTLAATEGSDTAAISGTVSSGPSGTLAATEAPDTAAATGTTGSTGPLAATEAPDTAAISGFVGSATGTLAATESPDTAAFVGGLPALVTQTVRVVPSYSPSLAIPEPSLFAPAGQRMVVTNFAGQPVAVAGNTGVKMIIDVSKALGRSAPVSHVSLTLTETTGRDPAPGARLSGSPTLVASQYRFQNIEQIMVGLVIGGVYVASIGLFMSDGSSHRFAAPFSVLEE